jgi:hypothetical protein
VVATCFDTEKAAFCPQNILVYHAIRTISIDYFSKDVQPLGRYEAHYVCCDVRIGFYVFEEEFMNYSAGL